MSISHNWIVYSPKIMTKRRRKCKLKCETIIVILVISLYSILSWYQVKDLQDYYAALGNFCAISLFLCFDKRPSSISSWFLKPLSLLHLEFQTKKL